MSLTLRMDTSRSAAALAADLSAAAQRAARTSFELARCYLAVLIVPKVLTLGPMSAVRYERGA